MQVAQGNRTNGAVFLLALELLTPLTEVFGIALRSRHHKTIARLWHPGQPQYLDRNRRKSRFDLLAVLVQQGPNTTAVHTRDERIPLAQRPLLHQDGGHRSPAPVELGFDDGTARPSIWTGLQFEQLGFEQY